MSNTFNEFLGESFELPLKERLNFYAGKDIVKEKNLDDCKEEILQRIKEIFYAKLVFENRHFRKLNNIRLTLNLGEFCLHNCEHCILDGDHTREVIDQDKFDFAMKKFASKLKHVDEIFFTGGELMDRENLGHFFEEFLKRGKRNFGFVSRGGLVHNAENIAVIKALKEKYPDFQVNITISLDLYSPANQKNVTRYISNIAEIVKMQFETFDNQGISFKATLPSQDEEESKIHSTEIKKLRNNLIKALVKDGYSYDKNKYVDGTNNICLSKDNKERILVVKKQRLSDAPRVRKNLKGGATKLFDINDQCTIRDIKSSLGIYIDQRFDVNYCDNPGHGGGCSKSIGNVLNDDRDRVLGTFLNTKIRLYELLSFDEIVDYVLDPEGKMFCANLRRSLKI